MYFVKAANTRQDLCEISFKIQIILDKLYPFFYK